MKFIFTKITLTLMFVGNLFAQNNGFDPRFNVIDLNGENGFAINGIAVGDNTGFSVSSAGDINGDGVSDLIISQSSRGSTYVIFGDKSGLPHPFELATLNGQNGFTIIGEAGVSRMKVSSVGDVNGDGVDDIIIGLADYDPNGLINAGRSYVVFGSSSGFPVTFDLMKLNGNNGFVINGIDEYHRAGTSISYAGDLNGDGLDDLVIGAPQVVHNSIDGSSYVIFGNDTGFPSTFELSSLDGQNGFAIHGGDPEDGNSGISVSFAGDVNGDGVDDVIIGAQSSRPNGLQLAGRSYVVFGSTSGFPNPLELSGIDGQNGFVINGEEEFSRTGHSVSHAGDVNGDGMDDVIIGAYRASRNGEDENGSSYVIFGDDTGLPSPLELSTLNGQNGFEIIGIGPLHRTGTSVSSAGDINGDGLDDVIIGSDDGAGDGLNFGNSFIVFGRNSAFPSHFDLSTLDGQNGIVIYGLSEGDSTGINVDSAGDVNADGLNDIILSSHSASPNGLDGAGSSFVIYGSTTLGFGGAGAVSVPVLSSWMLILLVSTMLIVMWKRRLLNG